MTNALSLGFDYLFGLLPSNSHVNCHGVNPRKILLVLRIFREHQMKMLNVKIRTLICGNSLSVIPQLPEICTYIRLFIKLVIFFRAT